MKTILLHLRVLRPLRSLAIVAFYAFMSHTWAKLWFGLAPVDARLFTFAVSVPLLCGLFIAAAAHEPMHRSFAFLLPGLRLRQLRVAAIDCALLAASVAALVSLVIDPNTSPLGVFGLAFGLSAALTADRRQRWGGTASGWAALIGWTATGYFGGAPLLALLRDTPLGVFAIGIAVGAVCLAHGFSREAARARAHTLFVAWQTVFFSHLFHRGMVQKWQAEVLAKHQLHTKPKTGREWNAARFAATVDGWRATLWHAQFGARGKRGSFLAVQLGLASACVAGALAGALTIRLMDGRHDFWVGLAHCIGPNLRATQSPAAIGGGGAISMMLPVFVVFGAALQLTPQIPYPISRRMLARVAFSHALRQCLAALTLPALGLYLVSLTGQLVSGLIRPGYGLPALVSVLLPLAALLPYLMTCATLRAPWARIAVAVPLGVAMTLIALLRPWGDASTTGVILSLAIGAPGFALLRHRLIDDYATLDLSRRPIPLIPTAG